MKTKKNPSGIVLETGLGKIIPIVGVQYNPTNEWMNTVYRFHHILDSDKKHKASLRREPSRSRHHGRRPRNGRPLHRILHQVQEYPVAG